MLVRVATMARGTVPRCAALQNELTPVLTPESSATCRRLCISVNLIDVPLPSLLFVKKPADGPKSKSAAPSAALVSFQPALNCIDVRLLDWHSADAVHFVHGATFDSKKTNSDAIEVSTPQRHAAWPAVSPPGENDKSDATDPKKWPERYCSSKTEE